MKKQMASTITYVGVIHRLGDLRCFYCGLKRDLHFACKLAEMAVPRVAVLPSPPSFTSKGDLSQHPSFQVPTEGSCEQMICFPSSRLGAFVNPIVCRYHLENSHLIFF